jgi:hypothetical protein
MDAVAINGRGWTTPEPLADQPPEAHRRQAAPPRSARAHRRPGRAVGTLAFAHSAKWRAGCTGASASRRAANVSTRALASSVHCRSSIASTARARLPRRATVCHGQSDQIRAWWSGRVGGHPSHGVAGPPGAVDQGSMKRATRADRKGPVITANASSCSARLARQRSTKSPARARRRTASSHRRSCRCPPRRRTAARKATVHRATRSGRPSAPTSRRSPATIPED